MFTDSKAFFEKVLQQTMCNCPDLMSKIMSQDAETNERFLVDLLSDRLAAILTGPPRESAIALQEPAALPEAEHEDDQNILLAMALGACECWGADIKCPHCSGLGKAGWQIPDRLLFQMLVRPAFNRLKSETRHGRRSIQRLRNN